LTSEYDSALSVFSRIAAWVFFVLLGLTAVLVILSFPAGVYTVFYTHLSNSTTAASLGTPYLWVGPLAFLFPFQVSLGSVFLAVTAIYAAMFALALGQGRGALATTTAALRKGVGEFLSNNAFVTLVGIGFFVYTAIIIDDVVSGFGAPIGNPFGGLDPLRAFVSLTLAPLREEFGFRVLIIGLMAFVVSFWRSKGVAAKALWRPSVVYEGVGRDTFALVMIGVTWAASSVVFGACHVVCGGGWDLGKLPEAIYGGVVLGYLYIRYGFHVAVLGHWGIDYLASVYAFYGLGAYGVPLTSESLPQALLDLDLVFFGVACILFVAYFGVRRIVVRKSQAVEMVGGY